jgi:flagellar motor switch protein FliN/FliY
MSDRIDRILKLEVPIVVRLAERTMRLGEVVKLTPGAIIELPKLAEEELDLLVNNKPIGTGTAVKVAENFGIRISAVGDARERAEAMAAGAAEAPQESDADAEAAALAEQLLSGQL